jgi:Uma2 family endonuclease
MRGMNVHLESAIQPLLRSPLLPEIVASLEATLREERERRQRFYEQLRDDQKAEFVDGQVVLHSPARDKHIAVRQNLERLLGTYVGLRGVGKVRSENCLCVFPRNDYEPDVVFFGVDKARALTDDTMKFPIPDFVVEVLSESTEERDRGVKFEDYESHGVAEYWIVDVDAEVVEQYLRQGERFSLALKSGTGELTSPTVTGFRIPIRALFRADENLAVLREMVGEPSTD